MRRYNPAFLDEIQTMIREREREIDRLVDLVQSEGVRCDGCGHGFHSPRGCGECIEGDAPCRAAEPSGGEGCKCPDHPCWDCSHDNCREESI